MGVRAIDVFEDSRLVVQQVKRENQCLDGVLNAYREACLDVKAWDSFHISYIPREENKEANILAQQASGYEVTSGMFTVKERSAIQSGVTGAGRPAMQRFMIGHADEQERPMSLGKRGEELIIGEESVTEAGVIKVGGVVRGDEKGVVHEESSTVNERITKEDWRQPIVEYL
jgi:hypothetical protein